MVLTSIIDENVTVENSEEIGLRLLIFWYVYSNILYLIFFSGPERIL